MKNKNKTYHFTDGMGIDVDYFICQKCGKKTHVKNCHEGIVKEHVRTELVGMGSRTSFTGPVVHYKQYKETYMNNLIFYCTECKDREFRIQIIKTFFFVIIIISSYYLLHLLFPHSFIWPLMLSPIMIFPLAYLGEKIIDHLLIPAPVAEYQQKQKLAYKIYKSAKNGYNYYAWERRIPFYWACRTLEDYSGVISLENEIRKKDNEIKCNNSSTEKTAEVDSKEVDVEGKNQCIVTDKETEKANRTSEKLSEDNPPIPLVDFVNEHGTLKYCPNMENKSTGETFTSLG